MAEELRELGVKKNGRSLQLPRVVLVAGLDDGRMAAELLVGDPRLDLVGLFVLGGESATPAGFRTFDDIAEPPVLRKISRIKNEIGGIRALAPDIIIVVGFSQIIPSSILDIPRFGVIGFHSAILPGRRGCSPIIWAIADGLTETGVTMFYMDEGIDTGDVIDVERFSIGTDDQAEHVLCKADQATITLLRRNLDGILDGTAPRKKQDENLCTYTRKRDWSDGEIDWSRPASEIVNLIRALSPPYPMAHTFGGDGQPILIEKASLATHAKLPPARFTNNNPLCRNVLCVVAHPDDEVLGIGGTLVRHALAGGKVVVVILSEGEDEKLTETERCSARRKCALDAAEVMGTHDIVFHDLPDQRLDSLPIIDVIKPVEDAIREFEPEIIYTHHGGDANTDHLTVFKATYAACRPMSKTGAGIERLLTFETPSSTDQAPQIGEFIFRPNTFVDVTEVWERKVAALGCYPTEMIGGLHPRSYEYIESLARMRGGYAGVKLAEAFALVRERVLI